MARSAGPKIADIGGLTPEAPLTLTKSALEVKADHMCSRLEFPLMARIGHHGVPRRINVQQPKGLID